MTPTTGIWLILLTLIVVVYSIYFFGEPRKKAVTLRQKLRTIIIPSFEFHSSSPSEAVDVLNTLAEDYDTFGDGVGFSVVLDDMDADPGEPLLLTLRNTRLWDLVELIALNYQLSYHLEQDSFRVTLRSPTDKQPLITRHYQLPVETFPSPWTCTDYLAYFKGYGLPFAELDGEQSHATYHTDTKVLEIKTSENTLTLIEKMFELEPLAPENN